MRTSRVLVWRCVMVLLFVFLFRVGGSISQGQQAGGKNQLDPASYRLKIETILEPTGKVAVYRVQIWTVNKREVVLHFDDGQNTQDGLSRPEKEGKLHRADFVLLASLREEQRKWRLEFRHMVGGASGMTVISDEVDAATDLKKLLDFPSAEGIHKLGHKQSIGRFRGKALEVEVR